MSHDNVLHDIDAAGRHDAAAHETGSWPRNRERSLYNREDAPSLAECDADERELR